MKASSAACVYGVFFEAISSAGGLLGHSSATERSTACEVANVFEAMLLQNSLGDVASDADTAADDCGQAGVNFTKTLAEFVDRNVFQRQDSRETGERRFFDFGWCSHINDLKPGKAVFGVVHQGETVEFVAGDEGCLVNWILCGPKWGCIGQVQSGEIPDSRSEGQGRGNHVETFVNSVFTNSLCTE